MQSDPLANQTARIPTAVSEHRATYNYTYNCLKAGMSGQGECCSTPGDPVKGSMENIEFCNIEIIEGCHPATYFWDVPHTPEGPPNIYTPLFFLDYFNGSKLKCLPMMNK